jgi:hypothetical protein
MNEQEYIPSSISMSNNVLPEIRELFVLLKMRMKKRELNRLRRFSKQRR